MDLGRQGVSRHRENKWYWRNDGSGVMLQTAAAAHGGEALYIQSDAGDVEACARTVAKMCALSGRVDVLVCAAGAAVPGGSFEVIQESWSRAPSAYLHEQLDVTFAWFSIDKPNYLIYHLSAKVCSSWRIFGISHRAGEEN